MTLRCFRLISQNEVIDSSVVGGITGAGEITELIDDREMLRYHVFELNTKSETSHETQTILIVGSHHCYGRHRSHAKRKNLLHTL